MIILQDVITKKKLVGTPSLSHGGGYDIVISPASFLYSALKDDPRKLIGRVFQEVEKIDHGFERQQGFVKVTRCVSRWLKPRKRGQLPDLMYQAVLVENVGTTLEAVEELDKYNSNDSGV